MVLSKNMLEQVITVFLSDEFMTSVVSNVDVLAGTFNKYLSGMSDLRMASIILMLLALMERLRIALLKQVVIGNQFALNTQAGLETMCYPDDTAPYFSGEMVSTWRLPGIQREV